MRRFLLKMYSSIYSLVCPFRFLHLFPPTMLPLLFLLSFFTFSIFPISHFLNFPCFLIFSKFIFSILPVFLIFSNYISFTFPILSIFLIFSKVPIFLIFSHFRFQVSIFLIPTFLATLSLTHTNNFSPILSFHASLVQLPCRPGPCLLSLV